MVDIWTAVLLVVILYLATVYWRRHRNLPPGPRGWPVIGNLHRVSGNSTFYKLMQEYRDTYGDIYSMRLGSHVCIFLNGHDVIREAFVDKADYFSDRPNWLFMVKMVIKNSGLIWTDDWKNVRKLTMRALRDFGVGKKSLEERVMDEAQCLCEQLAKTQGKPSDPRPTLINAITNIICTVVFGKRFDYGDEDFYKICDSLNFLVTYNMLISFPNMIPWTSFLMLFGKGGTAMTKFKTIRNYTLDRIQEHKETLDPDEIRDFIDLYLLNQIQDSAHFAQQKDEDALMIILDLFFAGTEGLATTLQWLILYMLHFPDVQRKCRAEIYEVIGSSRCPCKSDKGSLPYTEATILEVQRITSVGPVSLPHVVSKTLDFRGYTFPKDAMVLASLYTTMNDQKTWLDPQVFRPERWIDEHGHLKRHKAFLPFSIGRRQCLGEQLARLELFVFGVSMLQHLEFSLEDETTPPSVVPYMGVTMLPQPFNTRICPA